ncbi:DUF4190 domain-containing protein [Cryobacterium roopkundense]|uniref:DUF4190 domain-containing protein n=1 Tax=Cryobacterium roopkundense TaxID=1001240 RepID=A0A7W8ZZ77_9MICO|nr:DUF4190 domain-containing protein [Cryobacterium roopkundense]MBB5642949.1 hypothetical protein [Cryobacterium roopkundense]
MSNPSNPQLPNSQHPVQYQQNGYSPYNAPIAYQPVYAAQSTGLSATALVLGLVSIFFGFTFLVPLGALIFGILALKREPAGKGMAITGIVIGGLFMLFWVLFGGAILAVILAVMSTPGVSG